MWCGVTSSFVLFAAFGGVGVGGCGVVHGCAGGHWVGNGDVDVMGIVFVCGDYVEDGLGDGAVVVCGVELW